MQTPVTKRHMPLIVRVLLGLLLAPIAFVAGLMLILIVWMRTLHILWVREKFIRFNKQTLNPTTLKIAGGRSGVYATVKHVGRRSGRSYTTPVVAQPLGDGFVIPLPYDSSVDWCHNVLAAGTCTLIWNEQRVPVVTRAQRGIRDGSSGRCTTTHWCRRRMRHWFSIESHIHHERKVAHTTRAIVSRGHGSGSFT